MVSIWKVSGLSLGAAAVAWAGAYLLLDLFLGRVALPGPGTGPGAAAAALRAAARPYRAGGIALALLAWGAQAWALRAGGAARPLLAALLAGLGALDLLPVLLLWRSTLRKQFPHLRGHL